MLDFGDSDTESFAPDRELIIEKFPVLAGKNIVGRGCYSIVFECTENTVLKLTCDPVYPDFVRSKSGVPGVPKLVNDYGSFFCPEYGNISLLEVVKLRQLDRWDHETMFLESRAVASAVDFRLAARELGETPELGKASHAKALRDLTASKMFSASVSWALLAISNFIEKSDHDVVLDLQNPSNFMTDGTNLVISDPLVPVL